MYTLLCMICYTFYAVIITGEVVRDIEVNDDDSSEDDNPTIIIVIVVIIILILLVIVIVSCVFLCWKYSQAKHDVFCCNKSGMYIHCDVMQVHYYTCRLELIIF